MLAFVREWDALREAQVPKDVANNPPEFSREARYVPFANHGLIVLLSDA